MKAIYIDDGLHRLLKLRAAQRGLPLRRLVEDCVRMALRSPGEAPDVTTREVAAAAAGGGAFDFLARDEEDVYFPTDGKAIG